MKQEDADDSEQKRKPRGNCTLRQETTDILIQNQSNEDRGVATGVVAEEPEDTERKLRETLGDEPIDDRDAEGGGDLLEGNDRAVADESGAWWYFDTASNSHVTGNISDFVSFSEKPTNLQNIRGVAPNIASRIAGTGTVALVTEVEGEQVKIFVDNVLYIPGAEYGLFSPGLAYEQGFDFDFNSTTRNFSVLRERRVVVVATLQEATWGFQVADSSRRQGLVPENRELCNYTMADGVGSLTLWHERLYHICPQYLKTMVDKELVRGMLLTQCQQDTCDACHLGKQKRKAHRKKLDRATKEPNQVVYADLLIPGKSNATRYEAVLVILDGYSRFMTVHLLKDKDSKVVNKHMREYVHWAERQAGRSSSGQTYKVKPILSDKGGEFFNEEIDAWYDAKGIEHVKVGPKSSQLNLCERSHQSLEGMTKATLAHAGFPRSLWPEAIRNAAYVKNRVYNKGTKGIPYEMMFGVKPDIHHIRKFGALAYVHVSASPARKKHDPNVKIGFVLGYAEAVVGCKVYFPNEHTAKFVPDLRVAENVVYRDRHAAEVEEDDLSSLHFTHRDDEEQTTECEEEGMNEPSDEESRGLEEGEYDNDVEMDEEEHVDIMIRERVVGNIERHEEPEEPEVSEHSDGEHHEEGDKRREEHDTEVVDGTEVVDDSHLGEGKQSDTVDGEVAEQQEAVDSEAQSVTGTCGSSVAEQELETEER
ncbi:hypothetical protein PC120_g594 [Phytophthora cactorum]|nr:hypothetical protein PC120_g594 [Phytophthora cactorum]